MKDNENKKMSLLVENEELKTGADPLKDGAPNKAEKLKKPIIFVLMGVVFIGCMYLIFKPSSDNKSTPDIGLNDVVPQATNAGLQSDKQKAYEQEMMEQKEEEKRKGLMSLSDYWNSDSTTDEEAVLKDEENEEDYGDGGGIGRNKNPALKSYRNAQNTLSSFYEDDSYETQELRRQINELKEQLGDKNVPPATTVQDQLTLMEKSYEMASKYLPAQQNNTASQSVKSDSSTSDVVEQKKYFVAFSPLIKNPVSALYREPTDSAFMASWNENRNRGFYTAGISEQVVQFRNSVRARVQQTQIVTGESGVRLRLMEAARTPNYTIPPGTLLTANAKFQDGRLQLKVTSIELEGNIIAVDITIYDLDGQPGLYVPYSPEMNALTEIASNMSQRSGTSIMMTRSAGQQMAGDLGHGIVQGVSGYFSKKIRTPKVTLKAGHEVLLVSKN